MVMSDGTSAASGQSLHLPNLPCNSLSFSEVKKKSSHGLKVSHELALELLSKSLEYCIASESRSNRFKVTFKLGD